MSSVKAFRKAKKRSQEEAAKLLGVSQPYLSLIENGRRGVPKAMARKMSHDSEVGKDFPLECVLFGATRSSGDFAA